MKRLLISFSVLCGLPMMLSATEQEFSYLILEGAVYGTHAFPPLKVMLPEVKHPEYRMLHAANYAGNRPTWAVINKQLYLIGVEGKTVATKGARLLSSQELYPDLEFPAKITAFSGKIELEGRSLDYVLQGNVITIVESITLTFTKGVVTDVRKKTRQENLHE